jgi:hypothetical protein
MVNRFMTAQSTVATRRWGVPAIVTLAAMAALAALTLTCDKLGPELVRLSRTSIADEMREEHRKRVLGTSAGNMTFRRRFSGQSAQRIQHLRVSFI